MPCHSVLLLPLLYFIQALLSRCSILLFTLHLCFLTNLPTKESAVCSEIHTVCVKSVSSNQNHYLVTTKLWSAKGRTFDSTDVLPPFLQYKGHSLITYWGPSSAATFCMAALGYVLIYVVAVGVGIVGMLSNEGTLQCCLTLVPCANCNTYAQFYRSTSLCWQSLDYLWSSSNSQE